MRPPDLTSLTRVPILGLMKLQYSVYEAKAKLSEILRLVKQGKRITITERGREIARVVPLEEGKALEQRIADLQAAGILGPTPTVKPSEIRLGVSRPGALERFLKERD